MSLDIRLIPCLSDNYGILAHDPNSGRTVSVDAPEAGPILAEADRLGWPIHEIWVTHHHFDHVGGVAEIKAKTGAKAIGPAREAGKIEGLDRTVRDGDEVALGAHAFTVIETPGHTLGHVVYAGESAKAAFVGDALFVMGCGRLFEGTADQMWSYVRKMRGWPADMAIYCAHEYTEKNFGFAETLPPLADALRSRAAEIASKRSRGEPTVPTTIALERISNPFMLADDRAVAAAVGMSGADPASVFAELRARRNDY